MAGTERARANRAKLGLPSNKVREERLGITYIMHGLGPRAATLPLGPCDEENLTCRSLNSLYRS